MAEVVVDRLVGGDASMTVPDTATKLKLLGVDVASFGVLDGPLDVVYHDAASGTYAKLLLSDDAKTLLGGVLVGDATAYPLLRAALGGPLPAPPLTLLAPAGDGVKLTLPGSAQICSCNAVTKDTITLAIAGGATDVPAIK